MIESPRGRIGRWLMVSDGSPKPYRVKFRTPSFVNLCNRCRAALHGPADRGCSCVHRYNRYRSGRSGSLGNPDQTPKKKCNCRHNWTPKFNDLIGRYPVKRSKALIPMMIYAQDEYGFLGDEILDEIAKRLDLNSVQVTETLAYYSMLRRKPAGRYHIQVLHQCFLHGRGRQ